MLTFRKYFSRKEASHQFDSLMLSLYDRQRAYQKDQSLSLCAQLSSLKERVQYIWWRVDELHPGLAYKCDNCQGYMDWVRVLQFQEGVSPYVLVAIDNRQYNYVVNSHKDISVYECHAAKPGCVHRFRHFALLGPKGLINASCSKCATV